MNLWNISLYLAGAFIFFMIGMSIVLVFLLLAMVLPPVIITFIILGRIKSWIKRLKFSKNSK